MFVISRSSSYHPPPVRGLIEDEYWFPPVVWPDMTVVSGWWSDVQMTWGTLDEVYERPSFIIWPIKYAKLVLEDDTAYVSAPTPVFGDDWLVQLVNQWPSLPPGFQNWFLEEGDVWVPPVIVLFRDDNEWQAPPPWPYVTATQPVIDTDQWPTPPVITPIVEDDYWFTTPQVADDNIVMIWSASANYETQTGGGNLLSQWEDKVEFAPGPHRVQTSFSMPIWMMDNDAWPTSGGGGSAAFVQRKGDANDANLPLPHEFDSLASGDVSFTTLPSAGNLIVVCISENRGAGVKGVSTVTDNQGGTYTQAVTKTIAANNGAVSIYYREGISAPSGTFTVTVTMTGATFFDVGLLEYSGIKTSSSLNVTNSIEQNAGPMTVASTGASGTCVHVAVFTSDNNNMELQTAGQTERFRDTSPGIAAIAVEDTIAAGAQTLSWNILAAHVYVAVIAAFSQA